MRRGRKPHLTQDQAEEVREMYRGPWTPRQIARYFDVSTAVIHAVLNKTGAYKEVSTEESNLSG